MMHAKTRLWSVAKTQVVAQVLDTTDAFQDRRLRPLGHPPAIQCIRESRPAGDYVQSGLVVGVLECGEELVPLLPSNRWRRKHPFDDGADGHCRFCRAGMRD